MSATIQTFDLRPYKAAGYPAVAVSTVEEERLTAAILEQFPDKAVWRVTGAQVRHQVQKARAGKKEPDVAGGYAAAFTWLAEQQETILITLDIHHVLKNPMSYRPLRDSMPAYKQKGCLVILIAPAWTMPPELEHEIPVLDYNLPSRPELSTALDLCVEGAEGATVPDPTGMLDAASGLTLSEAESAFALSYALGGFSRDVVEREKLRLIKQSGYLEVYPPAPVESLGGLGGLREYIDHEVLPVQHNPRLRVRGLVFMGVPGTGKSLAAKVMGSLLGWPVLRCDISALKGSLVGQSETQMRAALKQAEAVSPCCFYIDEIEKAVSGHASSGQTDSGVTSGMVGILLTWLQEHNSPIITIMTCNDHSKLPPELTRAGRIDEKFFVDLPTGQERVEIAAIHLKRFGWPESMAQHVSDLTPEFTGAEIEQLVKSAARRSPDSPSEEVLTSSVQSIRPISRVRPNEIAELRKMGSEIFARANTPEVESTGPARKLSRKSQ